jgi:hypothetical protein
MIRDLDLIRAILMQIEAGEEFYGCNMGLILGDIEGFSRDAIDYHVRLLADGGYLLGTPLPGPILVQGLTWKGHDFVESLRPVGTWERMKKAIKDSKVGTLDGALKVALEFGEKALRKALGLD